MSSINEGLAATARWAEAHHSEVTSILANATGIPIAIHQKAADRTDFVIQPLNDRIIKEQQGIADRFQSLGLIPKPITIKDIVWSWTPKS